MIEDLDVEMRNHGLNGIVVFGDMTLANPDLTYVVGGNLPRGGMYFKRAGREPLLLVSNLDLGTARRLGRVRRLQTYTRWGMERLVRKSRSWSEGQARFMALILRHEGARGKVALFGRNDLASGTRLVDRLRKLGVSVVGEESPTVLELARQTKGEWEIEQVRKVGAGTGAVVKEVVAVLGNLKRKRGHLQIGKRRATVGLIKSTISSLLAREGLIAPEGTIFAIGPSGADPHNAGIPTDEIREGQLIVFDIFPQAETGYWFDLTRTYVVGRAASKARRMYEAVFEAQNAALDMLRAGAIGKDAMGAACDAVERAGFRTVRDVYEGRSKTLLSGFNHSLGHGVGLTIGERPYLSLTSKDPIREGSIVTVEPGVYLPRYGGVRIEDTVLVARKGVENLASVPKELEIS